MKNLKTLAILFILSLSLIQAFSQKPAATPRTDADVVKIETNLIQIDVVVTDKNGDEVTNLRREDFEVYENDDLMKISNFSYTLIKNKENSASANYLEGNDLETIPPSVGQIRRTLAIVVDDLRLAGSDVNYVKKALTKFISQQVQPNDLIAIIKTSGSIGILQQFTIDKKKLLKAIENIQWKPLTSVGSSPFPPIEITFADQVAANILSGIQENPAERDTQAMNDALKAKIGGRTDIENVVANFRSDQFVSGTLNVLLKTIDAMRQLAGRKSILFVVGGLSNITGDESKTLDTSGQNKFVSFQNKELLRRIAESANRSAISIYPLDSRGIQTVGLSAEDSTRGGMFSSMNGAQIDQKVTNDAEEITRSQDGLKILAQETGGKAFINSNDLDNGLRSMLSSQNGYYLLAYQPDSETFDAKNRRFNKLTVKVRRPNVNVTYRSGFFNVADDSSQNRSNSNDAVFVQKLLSPYRYDDINLSITSIFAGNDLTSSTLRTLINVKPADLQFVETKDGRKRAAFDLLAIAFDENSIPIARLGRGFSVTVKPDEYAKMLETGISCNLSFATKSVGLHLVKVAVRDSNSAQIGTVSDTINVPNVKADEMALSGILLENYSIEQWKALQSNLLKATTGKMQQDTAVRKFKRGTVLTYTYTVYFFPAIKESKLQNLNALSVLWKDGKEIFRGAPEKINATAKFALQRQNQRGAFMLGTEMTAGRYVLRITVGPERQSIDFELID